MKKIITSIAVVTALVSCQKEILNETNGGQPTEGNVVALTVGADTKVMSFGLDPRWNTSAEDLSVLAFHSDAVAKYKFTKPDSGADKTPATAIFKGSIDEGASLKYAFYPYRDDYYNIGENDTLTLYSADRYTYNAYSSIATTTPFVGKIIGTSVTMKSPCAYLKVSFPDSTGGQHFKAMYHYVTVEAEGISGKFSAIFEGDSLAVKTKGTKNSVKATPRDKSGVYGDLYIPIIPGEYNSVKISLYYTNDLYDTYSRTSTKTQTFKSNNAYDCGYFSGPYAESVNTGLCTVDGTTLTMNGSATVWKYSGVTNSDYSFKFLYRETDTQDWSEVTAIPTGEGTNVSFSANATIDANKTYEYKAQVTACRSILEGNVNSSSMKTAKVTISFNYETKNISTFMTKYNWSYDESTVAAKSKRITTEDGVDCFPVFNPSGSTTVYWKTWDGTKWGEVESNVGTSNYMLGSCLTATDSLENSYDFRIYPTGDKHYYTIAANKLCFNKDTSSIKICCPVGKAIVSVTMTTAKKGDSFSWGLGDKHGTDNIVKKITHTDSEKIPEPIVLNVPKVIMNKELWIVGGTRVQTITVEYAY